MKGLKACLFFVSLTAIGSSQITRDSTHTGSRENRRTRVTIAGEQFFINGKPTFEGRYWKGHKIEGLLPNSRMVQGIFDDENSQTAGQFSYPDTKIWDAQRNTSEFIAAMPSWYAHGLISFTLNMQGGSPLGYGNKGWINTAYDAAGNLKPAFMNRLEKILNKADELGMIPILGLFYFGQDEMLADDEAVRNAVRNTVSWILDKGYQNILIEIANECDNQGYDRTIIKKSNIHELIVLAKSIHWDGRHLLVSTSFNGGVVPSGNVVKVSDYILFHGNGVSQPERIIQIVNEIRALPDYRTMPIVCNEDDHFNFDKESNNFMAATSAYASWGYFDYRMKDEKFEDGFQSVPVDWGINSERKKAFFRLLKEMTGF
jgi:hypothetical protein